MSMIKRPQYIKFTKVLLNLKTLLVVAGFVHLLATIIVYLVGRSAIFPNWILEKGTMREDALRYFEKCELLSQGLSSNGNYDFLITSSEQIHIRFYALSHFLLSDILGSNILTLELVNLPLFLLILFLIYKIGELLYEPKVGFVAAYIIMLFPSFVLHTTQPLRDTLFAALFLFLLFQFTRLIKKPLTIKGVLIWSLIAISTYWSLWFVRNLMILVYWAMMLSALFLLLYLNFKTKWKYKYNLIPILLLLLTSYFALNTVSGYLPLKRQHEEFDMSKILNFIEEQKKLEQPTYLININATRFRFSSTYQDAGSNIDVGYVFEDTAAFIAYLPKALAIGLLAPFPNTWLGEGVEYGKMGRILSGIETAVMYIFMLFAINACWRKMNLSILFILSSVFIAAIALGLVVINVGAIYRLRYVFWFLLIILGTKGAFEFLEVLGKRKKTAEV